MSGGIEASGDTGGPSDSLVNDSLSSEVGRLNRTGVIRGAELSRNTNDAEKPYELVTPDCSTDIHAERGTLLVEAQRQPERKSAARP